MSDSSLSTVIKVYVIVTDVNEGPPVFSGTCTASIAEDSSPGTSVADVVASDEDLSTSLRQSILFVRKR